VAVTLRDAEGNTATTAANAVTVAIGSNPAGGTLSGTTTVAAVSGVATFSNLSIDKVGTGYTLTAAGSGLAGATSNSFDLLAGLTAVAVSAGQYHNCGLASGGAAYCWGWDAYGELGDGTTTDRLTPVAVSGGLSFAALSAADWGTCGVTTGGAAYCWGVDYYLQLGGTSTPGPCMSGDADLCSPTPLAVPGGLSFSTVSLGEDHACGLTTAGAAYCWGNATYGALGNGSETGPQPCGISSSTCNGTPVAVSGGLRFATISAGEGYSCGVTTAGAAYCWGNNGDGTASSNTPALVTGGLTWASLSAGPWDACGVTTTGAAYCWGDNTQGELGVGSTTGPQTCFGQSCSTTPVAVAGGLHFASVSAGYMDACGVTTAGAAYCWGLNANGQLGDGTTTNRSTPVAVAGGLTWAAVSAGSYQSCGLTTTGAAYCWGWGWLGDGLAYQSDVPVRVATHS